MAEVVTEERWVPVGEYGDEWEPRSYEDAVRTMTAYPLGWSWSSNPGSGDPGGIKYIRKETRTVTEWADTDEYQMNNKEEK